MAVTYTHDITAAFNMDFDPGTITVDTVVAHGAFTGRLAEPPAPMAPL